MRWKSGIARGLRRRGRGRTDGGNLFGSTGFRGAGGVREEVGWWGWRLRLEFVWISADFFVPGFLSLIF